MSSIDEQWAIIRTKTILGELEVALKRDLGRDDVKAHELGRERRR